MRTRAAFLRLSFAVGLSASAPAGAAAPPDLAATAACERRVTKGRVVCEVDVETTAARIAWADVVVVQAPAFAPPLRSRVGSSEARVRSDRRLRIPVAFIANGLGKGKVVLRARAVVCTKTSAAERCASETGEAATDLVVGADVE